MEESVKPDKHNKQKCPLMMYTCLLYTSDAADD